MSLTQILGSRHYPELRAWFLDMFPRIGSIEKLPILVPSNGGSYAGAIGQAFDYMFRFHLERLNPQFVIGEPDWVAETALGQLKQKASSPNAANLLIGYHRDSRTNAIELVNEANASFQVAMTNYNAFIDTGHLTDALIESSLFLAKLDLVYRAQIIDKQLFIHDPIHIQEVRQLLDIVPWEEFVATKHCILNPNFGFGSILVAGADADVVIDHWLCDLKTSKKLEIQRRDLNQIIGYYILSIIGGLNGKSKPNIRSIGFYFAKYGFLWKLPVKEYYAAREWKVLARDFAENLRPDLLEIGRLDFLKN